MSKSQKEKEADSLAPDVVFDEGGGCAISGTRCCATVAAYTAAAGFSSLCLQTLSTYIVSQVTSLEKQFGLSSIDSGTLVSCNDIGFLSTILFFSHFGRHSHIPRILAFSTIVYGIAGIICSISQFIEPFSLPSFGSNVSSGSDDEYLCNVTRLDVCTDSGTSSGDVASGSWVVYMLGISLVVQGMCKAPRTPLSTVYIDNNVVNKDKTGLFLGILTTLTLFGPALAYGLGGVFSKIPVDLKDTLLNPEDPRWIGAWWLGFLVFGSVSLVTAVPLFFFKKSLRGTPKQYEAKASEEQSSFTDKVKALPLSLWRVLMSPVFTLCLCGIILVTFTVAGYVSFGPKYLENVFTVPAWQANIIQAGQAAVSIGLGTFLGGFLTSRFKMNPKGCLKFVVVANFLALGLEMLNFIFGCELPHIVGFDSGKVDNSTCNCSDVPFLPVCGVDTHTTYFSPCHAGCLVQNETTYSNCFRENGSDVTLGMCPTGCWYLYPFVGNSVVYAIIGTLAVIPSYLIMLRSVREEDKSMAMGVLSFSMSLLSFLPAPILYGKVIDTTCDLWNYTCGTRGSCALYDIVNMRFRMVGTNVAARSLAFVFFVAAFIVSRLPPKLEKERLDDKSDDTKDTQT